MRHRLRLFTGDEPETLPLPEPQIAMRLGDITRALRDAGRWDRTFLQDFEDDEVRVTPDLYEILRAYMRLRPGA